MSCEKEYVENILSGLLFAITGNDDCEVCFSDDCKHLSANVDSKILRDDKLFAFISEHFFDKNRTPLPESEKIDADVLCSYIAILERTSIN